MFKRIILDDWQHLVPYICFALIAGAFALIVIRALRMKKTDINHLSSLPLQSPSKENSTDLTHDK